MPSSMRATHGPGSFLSTVDMMYEQSAETDPLVVPRLVVDAVWSEDSYADEFMLPPGGIDAITEFWNWINDGPGSGGVGLHGDFNMTGSYDEWEQARRLVTRPTLVLPLTDPLLPRSA